MTLAGLPLFAPPTGPATRVAKFARGPGGYAAWKASPEGGRAWRFIEFGALALARLGHQRISTRTLAADARQMLKVSINDHWTALLADDLVSVHPQLMPLVERRKRKAA